MNRQEHIEWCKERARPFGKNYSAVAAWIAFRHDMNKRDETKDHPMFGLGDKMCAIVLNSPDSDVAKQILNSSHPLGLRSFIEGFN